MPENGRWDLIRRLKFNVHLEVRQISSQTNGVRRREGNE